MTIVVGYDGRLEGRDAVALGPSRARALEEPLLVASVDQSPQMVFGLSATELRAQAERTAAAGAAQLPADLERRHVAVLGRSPAEGLHDFAEEELPTALVVGSSHRGPFGRVIAGRVASRLFAGAPCPIAVAPRGTRGTPARSFARSASASMTAPSRGTRFSVLPSSASRPARRSA